MTEEVLADGNRNAIKPLKPKIKFSLFITFIIVALTFLTYVFIPEVQLWMHDAIRVLISNDQENIRSWVTNFGWFGPILLVLAMIGQMFLMVIPTTLLLIVCIVAYGPIWGSALALFAIYSASSAGYFIGRVFGSFTVEKLLGSTAKARTTVFLEKYGFWAIFITRLNPFLSNDVVSLVSGMVKMDYWKFSFASITGITPLILIIAFFGESTQTLTYLLVGSGIALVILVGYKIILKKKSIFYQIPPKKSIVEDH
ncbi:TVP38/TMEM64 family protein [Salinimicrobium sp. TH3]|uniref:TVP38/TMEM64 family protein n=1 Tax=Salinimicrobium sp. TH3 TaxID=2997342 RepID=UPI002275753B|nr:TVP38/TMEM64 family protein [Salinimicrobium sp. TH3]MCY2688443.1 TVP38/TMEM64 family protein [Salinimicrobium sp. TH3]